MSGPESPVKMIGAAAVLVLAGPALAGEVTLGAYSALSRPVIDILARGMSKEVTLEANNGPSLGVMAAYGKYKLEISPSLFGEVKDDGDHGPTRFFDAKLSRYARRWGADLYGQYFRGFYADSSAYYGNIERDGLKTSVFILNAYFPVLKSSSVEKMEWGIGENGADFNLLYLLGASSKGLVTDRTLLPLEPRPGSKLADLRELRITDAYCGLGGGINTYFHGMHFDYTLFLGAGPQYRSADVPIDRFKGSLKIHMQANWGYAWKWAAFGMVQKFDMNGFDEDGDDIVFTTLLSKIYASADL